MVLLCFTVFAVFRTHLYLGDAGKLNTWPQEVGEELGGSETGPADSAEARAQRKEELPGPHMVCGRSPFEAGTQ